MVLDALRAASTPDEPLAYTILVLGYVKGPSPMNFHPGFVACIAMTTGQAVPTYDYSDRIKFLDFCKMLIKIQECNRLSYFVH